MRTLDETETEQLRELRELPGADRKVQPDSAAAFTLGQKVADEVAITMGSWRFIIIQSVVLAI